MYLFGVHSSTHCIDPRFSVTILDLSNPGNSWPPPRRGQGQEDLDSVGRRRRLNPTHRAMVPSCPERRTTVAPPTLSRVAMLSRRCPTACRHSPARLVPSARIFRGRRSAVTVSLHGTLMVTHNLLLQVQDQNTLRPGWCKTPDLPFSRTRLPGTDTPTGINKRKTG